ncbi:asparagine synthase C-terminal domain-containing protein [Halobaculum sp. MBLA0147]|uniref:asparagine synthase C-terminal domain-containing protein n=1 Tax=Halobaculum sp. MBLA0147 TaxID=3079934 RepID=UPI00352544F5
MPGTTGFAGLVCGVRDPPAPFDTADGARGEDTAASVDLLVRDCLGRRPLYVDRERPRRWAFEPTTLADPELLPAGHALRLGDPVDEAEHVWSLPDPEPLPVEEALDRVETAVLSRTRAVAASTAPGPKTAGSEPVTVASEPETVAADGVETAVAFSGGVDSAVVAAGLPEAPLYVAGFEGCHDVAAAREAAAAVGREGDLRIVEIDHEDLRRAVRAVTAATGRTNPMDVSIAVPLFLVAERAAADGYDRLAVGQGADELFGGYAKLVEPASDDRVDATTVRGARREVVESLAEQLPRDVCTLRAAGVEPVAPLLHDDVVAAALRLPGEAIATPDERKVALRRAADGFVPPAVRTADKKAVQYGTYVSRELDRLARRAGFKRRMDDHVGRYVRALAAGVDDPSPEEW